MIRLPAAIAAWTRFGRVQRRGGEPVREDPRGCSRGGRAGRDASARGRGVGGHDYAAAAGGLRVLLGELLDLVDVPASVVVGVDRCRPVCGGAVGVQIVGSGVDGVGLVVDARRGRSAGRVDLICRPCVAGGAADPDLHRPGGSVGVGAGVHARKRRLIEVALDLVDRGQVRPSRASELVGAGGLLVGRQQA